LRSDKNHVRWRNVPFAVQLELLKIAAEEWGIDIWKINSFHLQFRKLSLLGGRTLRPLYLYYRRLYKKALDNVEELSPEIRRAVEDLELEGLGTMEFMRRVLGIYHYYDYNEVVKVLSSNRKVDWDLVPFEVKRKLLLSAVREWQGVLHAERFSYRLDFLGGGKLFSLYEYYKERLKQGKRNYRALPPEIRDRLSEEEFRRIKNTTQFIKAIFSLQLEKLERTRRKLQLMEDTFGQEGEFSKEEVEWIREYRNAYDESFWKKMVERNPRQIAFYVRELAIEVAKKNQKFTGLWEDLLSNRVFREYQVPVLGMSLAKMLNYFGDAYAILKYLEEKGLISEIEEEVRQRLSGR
jgi:two-component sensor histidine kinase